MEYGNANVQKIRKRYDISTYFIIHETCFNSAECEIDSLALVIYAKGENGQWHVSGDYADAQGNITYSDPIEGNSKVSSETQELSTSALFQETDKITDLSFVVVRLKPVQKTVPLEQEGNFGLPE